MKLRNGFVSNSSSTSFCIWGIYSDDSKDVEKIIEFAKKNPKGKEFFEEYPDYDPEEDGIYEIEHLIVTPDNHLEIINSPWDSAFWLGRPYATIGNDETGGSFKASTQNAIDDIFGVGENTCSHQEEAWRDG
ncbi:MAG: hypothetical protein ABIC57_01595 [bacterium]